MPLKIQLKNGNSIEVDDGAFPATIHRYGGAIRLINQDNHEVLVYASDEWKEDPEQVIGAFFAAVAKLEASTTAAERVSRRTFQINPPRILRIFDNGGATADRYTVVFKERADDPRYWIALGLSDNPEHPQGFSQWTETSLPNNKIGKHIFFKDLPPNVQKHVRRRQQEMIGR